MPVKALRIYTYALIASDILAVLAAFTIAYIIRVKLDNAPLLNEVYALEFFYTFLKLTPLYLLVMWSLGLYSPNVYQKRLLEAGKLLVASFIGILLVLGYSFAIEEPIFPAKVVPLYALFATFILLLIGREVLRWTRNLAFRFGLGVQRVMIIGSGSITKDLVSHINNTARSGYEVIAVVSSYSSKDDDIIYFRSLEKAVARLDELKVDTIIHTSLYDDSERNQIVMSAAQTRHIQYCFIPGESEFYSGKNQIDVFLGYPFIKVHQTPLVGWGEVVKQIFDGVMVVLTLPLWGGLILVIALFQKLFNKGPVLYKSRRLTRYSKPFNLYKFRTMGADYGSRDAAEEFREMGRDDLAEEYKLNRKVANDPRITKFGKFLRVTSLDEVPQLINVLKGDLSLVGPRPILPQELHRYHGRGALLHSVKSGVTGLWQVSGRNDLDFDERVDLELYYAQNWSFWLDIKILFKTIAVVLFHHGAK